MSIRNKKTNYSVALLASNVIMMASTVLTVGYLVIPLFGGKLFLDAIFKCASWTGIAVGLKIVLKRAINGRRIRTRDHLLLCLVFILNILAWFQYPANLIIILLGIAGLFISYKKQRRDNME
jgi:hypothetical protein